MWCFPSIRKITEAKSKSTNAYIIVHKTVAIMEKSSFLPVWIPYENRMFHYFSGFTNKTYNGAQNMASIYSVHKRKNYGRISSQDSLEEQS